MGAAFHAFTSQIKDVMGVRLPRRRGLFNVPLVYYDLVHAAPDANVTALVVSAVAMAVLAVFNEVVKVGGVVLAADCQGSAASRSRLMLLHSVRSRGRPSAARCRCPSS